MNAGGVDKACKLNDSCATHKDADLYGFRLIYTDMINKIYQHKSVVSVLISVFARSVRIVANELVTPWYIP